MKDPVTEHLEHYGIKGMRWGVRRPTGKNGRVSSVKKSSVDFRTTKDLRKRPAHTLTNMQLKKVNERMQLESKFSQMNPSKIAKGQRMVKGVLATAGTVTAMSKLISEISAKAAVKTGKKAVEFGARAPAEYTSLLRKF